MGHMSPAIKAKRGRFGPGGLAPTMDAPVAPASAEITLAAGGYSVSASDAIDGDISATATWTSDLDGLLGTGAAPTLTLTTLGTHVITVEATAPTGGQTVSDTVSVSAVNSVPVMGTPVAPASVTTAVATGGYSVSASDAIDGDISATATWTSDLDGLLGTGAAPTLTLTTVGTHVITVEATAATGAQTVSDTVSVDCTV